MDIPIGNTAVFCNVWRVDLYKPASNAFELLTHLLVAEARDHVEQLFISDEAPMVIQFVLIDGVSQFSSVRVGVLSSVTELASFWQSFRAIIAIAVTSIIESLSRLAQLLERRHG